MWNTNYYTRENVSRFESIEELRTFIQLKKKNLGTLWAQEIQGILKQNGYRKTRMAKLCGVSRHAVMNWCEGSLPRTREKLKRIGMAANYDLDTLNACMAKFGGYQELYAKLPEDLICIYVVQQFSGEVRIQEYDRLIQEMHDRLENFQPLAEEAEPTGEVYARIGRVKPGNEEDLFSRENLQAFQSAYRDLYAVVKAYLKVNCGNHAESVYEIAEAQNWSASLRRTVSEIRQNKWQPRRNQIISLGSHLGMDREMLDRLLRNAHMQELSVDNLFECVVMYILDSASLEGILDESIDTYDPDILLVYARKIIESLDMKEFDFFLKELPEVLDGE